MNNSESKYDKNTYIGYLKLFNGGMKVIPGEIDNKIISNRDKILEHLNLVLSGGKSLKDKNYEKYFSALGGKFLRLKMNLPESGNISGGTNKVIKDTHKLLKLAAKHNKIDTALDIFKGSAPQLYEKLETKISGGQVRDTGSIYSNSSRRSSHRSNRGGSPGSTGSRGSTGSTGSRKSAAGAYYHTQEEVRLKENGILGVPYDVTNLENAGKWLNIIFENCRDRNTKQDTISILCAFVVACNCLLSLINTATSSSFNLLLPNDGSADQYLLYTELGNFLHLCNYKTISVNLDFDIPGSIYEKLRANNLEEHVRNNTEYQSEEQFSTVPFEPEKGVEAAIAHFKSIQKTDLGSQNTILTKLLISAFVRAIKDKDPKILEDKEYLICNLFDNPGFIDAVYGNSAENAKINALSPRPLPKWIFRPSVFDTLKGKFKCNNVENVKFMPFMENLIQRYTNSKKGGYDDNRHDSYRSNRGGYDDNRHDYYRSNRAGYDDRHDYYRSNRGGYDDDRHDSYRSNNSRRSSYSRGGSHDILDDVRDATSSTKSIGSTGYDDSRYATYFGNNKEMALKVLKKYYKIPQEERYNSINNDFDLRDLYLGALNAEFVQHLQVNKEEPKDIGQIKAKIFLDFEKMINSYLEKKYREKINQGLKNFQMDEYLQFIADYENAAPGIAAYVYHRGEGFKSKIKIPFPTKENPTMYIPKITDNTGRSSGISGKGGYNYNNRYGGRDEEYYDNRYGGRDEEYYDNRYGGRDEEYYDNRYGGSHMGHEEEEYDGGRYGGSHMGHHREEYEEEGGYDNRNRYDGGYNRNRYYSDNMHGGALGIFRNEIGRNLFNNQKNKLRDNILNINSE